MHGEYKVPGGKLVVANVEADNQHLTSVSISGDFFLEPDSALETINQALVGLHLNANVSQISQAIENSLGENVMMAGFSPQAIAIAVRRALGKASGWHDHVFDVIPAQTLPAVQHVALDEVIVNAVASGQRGPTLRFWDWPDSVVVIGSFQSLKNEIDSEGAKRHGIEVVRRVTGGGAMFMEPGNCITYSLVVPVSLVEGLSFEQSYAFLDDWVLGALAEVGIKAHYVPLNDIASDKGKIGGAAQKRFANGIVLHHVTMAYDINADRMLEVLRIGREKLSDKGTTSANKRVDPMRSQTGMARETIIESFINHFQQRYSSQLSQYKEQELAQAKILLEDKFMNPEWVAKVP
ncbi:MAG TPA: biotin/lipoate A/B protein ligase family protein [Marinobacter sp.]|nr:biotin/lipoate A/B protein ligase family protein [Marinobacter sp.]